MSVIWFIIFLLLLNLILMLPKAASATASLKGGNPWNADELIRLTEDNPEEFKDIFGNMTLDFMADYEGDPEYFEEEGFKADEE